MTATVRVELTIPQASALISAAAMHELHLEDIGQTRALATLNRAVDRLADAYNDARESTR